MKHVSICNDCGKLKNPRTEAKHNLNCTLTQIGRLQNVRLRNAQYLNIAVAIADELAVLSPAAFRYLGDVIDKG
jgi:hypothetical protein